METSYKTQVNWKDRLNNKERQCEDAKTDTELVETISTGVLQVNESQISLLNTNQAMNIIK